MEKKASNKVVDYFLLCYFAAGLLFASFYGTWWIGVGVSGLCLLAYYVTKWGLPASDLYQYVLSAVLGIFMALYIYQMHGLFEMHFFAFIGSAILITYQNWKLQFPIMLIVVVHHGAFGYLQNIGYEKLYFTQLGSFPLQTFIIHVVLAAMIFFTSGLWAYRLRKDTEVKAAQAREVERLQRLALMAANEQKEQLQRHLAVLDKAVAEGKYEVASEFMHDIGNATVGFGSYLTQIRRLQDEDDPKELMNLSTFFASHREQMTAAIGESKAAAVIQFLSGLAEATKTRQGSAGELISRQAQAIGRIQDILHLQRQHIEGDASRERRPVSIQSVINDVLAMVFPEIDRNGIVVILDLPGGIPDIKGDRTRLMQTLRGILENSIEAIGAHGMERRLSVKVAAGMGGITVEVGDTGCGFAPDVARQLFQPGFSTKQSSAALPLHSCRGIMESHSGTLEVTSDGPGKGAVATLRFPV